MATRDYKGSVLHITLARAFEHSPLNQREVAEALGITQQTVSDWLNGKARPSPERFPRIEELLGLEDGALYATLTQSVDLQGHGISSGESWGTPTVSHTPPVDDGGLLVFASGEDVKGLDRDDVEEVQAVVDTMLDRLKARKQRGR